MQKIILLIFSIIGVIILLTFLDGSLTSSNTICPVTYTYTYDETDFTENLYEINLLDNNLLINDSLYTIDIYFTDDDIHYSITQDRILRSEANVNAFTTYVPSYDLNLSTETLSITLSNVNFNTGTVVITAYYNTELITDYDMTSL